MMRTQGLFMVTIAAIAAIGVTACCKKGDDEQPVAPVVSEAPVVSAEPEKAPEPEPSTDPEWKQKCPDADRPESGTVTVLKELQIYKTPDTTGEKSSTINPGTWVNLLGAKSTWLCVDYPCGVAQLCPGWIQAQYTKRKVIEDAGVPGPDAAAKDAAPEAAPPPADGGRTFRIPPHFLMRDAGGGTTSNPPAGRTPPGGRPPGGIITKK